MPFKRSEMFFEDYNWTARDECDDPRVTGEPDRTLLDRTQGYEMLYFVNKTAEKLDIRNPTTVDFQKIEKAVRRIVPANIRRQQDIFHLLRQTKNEWWDEV